MYGVNHSEQNKAKKEKKAHTHKTTTTITTIDKTFHVTGVVSPANQHLESTIKKEKPTCLCAPLEFLLRN